MKHLLSGEKRSTLVGLTLVILLFFLANPQRDLFYSNQNTYFAHGLALAGRDFLQIDWYSQTRPLHISFTLLIALIDWLGILPLAVSLIEGLLYLALLAAVGLVAAHFYDLHADERLPLLSRGEFVGVALLIFVLLLQPFAPLARLAALTGSEPLRVFAAALSDLKGLANQKAFAYYLEPAEFGTLIMLGLALLPFERWRLAAVLFGVAALLHVSYLIHCALIVLVVALWLFNHGQRREALIVALIYGVLALPISLYVAFCIVEPSASAEAGRLIALRQPHHAFPWVWWGADDLAKTLLMAGAAIVVGFGGRGVLRWVLPALVAAIMAGVLLVALTRSEALGIMFPWRSSAFVFPFSLAVLAAVLARGIHAILPYDRLHARRLLIALVSVVLVLGLAFAGRRALLRAQRIRPVPPADAIAHLAREHTTPQDVIMVPGDFMDFRLEAGRAIYIDRKSGPYREIVTWWERSEAQDAFYALSNAGARQAACRSLGVDYYVIDAALAQPGDNVLTSTAHYALARCDH